MPELGQTPSQTLGPYFSMRLGRPGENDLAPSAPEESRIRVEGLVLDGERNHIEDALIEIWQANAAGRYRHPADDRADLDIDPGFTGFGRAMSDFTTGGYWFETVKPGPVPDREGEPQAPHINLVIQARGMLNPSYTRVYFSDEAEANERDMALALVPRHRRQSLIAEIVEGSSPRTYRFDIKFQGGDETVFFEF